MSEQSYLGSISGWAPSFAPRNWLFCQGQTIRIQQYSALFSLLGVVYGGDGQNTFCLPNLQGRTPIGAGQSPGTSAFPLGAAAGAESVTLTGTQLPTHTHTAAATISASLPANSAAANSASPADNLILAAANGASGRDSIDVKIYGPAPGSVNLALSSSATVTVQPTGGSTPVSIMQPFLAINYIICMSGIFPTRN